MLLDFLVGVHEDKACPLAMKVKDSLFGNLGWLEKLRSRKIIGCWELPKKSTRSEHEQIEIGGQNAIDKALLHKLSNANVSPVNLRFIHLASDEVPSFTN